jgi:hypothetical protein
MLLFFLTTMKSNSPSKKAWTNLQINIQYAPYSFIALTNASRYRTPSPGRLFLSSGRTGDISASMFGSKNKGIEILILSELCRTLCRVETYNPPVHSANISPILHRKQPYRIECLSINKTSMMRQIKISEVRRKTYRNWICRYPFTSLSKNLKWISLWIR